MPSLVFKKPPARDAKAPSQARASISGVKQVTELGNGYVIVKLDLKSSDLPLRPTGVKTGKGPTAFLDTPVPAIPTHQIKRILEKFAQGTVTHVTQGTAKKKPAYRMPIENQRFMSGLIEQEKLNRQRDIESGALLSSVEFCRRLQMSRQGLSKAVKSHRMFSLDGPSGTKVYPAFFADPKFDKEDLEKVSRALGEMPGPSKLEFFVTRKVSLNSLTPIEAIAKGLVEEVLRSAAGFRER